MSTPGLVDEYRLPSAQSVLPGEHTVLPAPLVTYPV